jgi:hypothetical protein
MDTPHTLRLSIHIRIACMTLLAVVGAVQNLAGLHFTRWIPGETDAASVSERRFQALKDSILSGVRPPRGQIGYISDQDPASVVGSAVRLFAQYSLAPLVLVPAPPSTLDPLDPALRGVWQSRPRAGANPEWLAGNFHDSANAAGIARREGLVIVRDFGAGVMLLRRARQ